MKTCLAIIDPQFDFCMRSGSLFVPNADIDMNRLADLINRKKKDIDQIYVSLDDHEWLDVAHPAMWIGKNGQHPEPFTIIKSKDIEDGTWSCVIPEWNKRFIRYCKKLEEKNRYPLCIWPPHCLIGSQGASIHPVVMEYLKQWQEENRKNVIYIRKGRNRFTEHFSAIKAEVPDPEDTSTWLDPTLPNALKEYDQFLLAGEAGSHCVKSTLEDMVDYIGYNRSKMKKIVWIEDCISPVQSPHIDFPSIQRQFVTDMVKKGMRVSKSTEIDW